jgi:hypothetical protein
MANGNSNGKKTSKQLDGEINEILAARQKREARQGAAKGAAKPKASASLPSQSEYERNELAEANQKLREVERAPLAERKEAAAEFLAAMRDHPAMVAERIGWLLDGNYGYGSMLMAKRVLGSPRMNRPAALTHMIGAFEWSTPGAMAIAGWKKLTKAQQIALDKAVLATIKSAESEE